jgi:hypothetical protein
MRSRSAFALIELPMFLLVLFLCGLLIAFVFSLFSGPAPWYAWLICGLILPVALLLLVAVSILFESWQPSQSLHPNSNTKRQGQPRNGLLQPTTGVL